jgi:hypothetical protein
VQTDGTVIPVPLIEIGAGLYRGTVPLPQTGVYRTQVVVENAQGASLGVITGGAVVPPSAEYVQRDGNAALLQALAQQTGGRYDLASERVWDAPATAAQRAQPIVWPLLWLAVLLWPLDIAVRRVVWGRSFVDAVRAHAGSLRRASPANVPSSATTVVDRKRARAAARQTAAPIADTPIDAARQRRSASTQQSKTGVRSEGTSVPSAASSSPTATDLANWRRSRRGVVERPEQDDTVTK